MSKERFGASAANTGPPAGREASAAQTAPTTPQPVVGDAPSSGSSPGSWWQGSGSAARSEGAQAPDFSSWYDPSPRSGPAAQARSGSPHPAPPGDGPAAWSGAAAPPPPRAPARAAPRA